jgi:hypothetical protein
VQTRGSNIVDIFLFLIDLFRLICLPKRNLLSIFAIMIKKVILIFILFLSFHFITNAAPPPPPGGGPSCWPPPCVPIDSGIGLLVAAGVAYGAKKILSSKKNIL